MEGRKCEGGCLRQKAHYAMTRERKTLPQWESPFGSIAQRIMAHMDRDEVGWREGVSWGQEWKARLAIWNLGFIPEDKLSPTHLSKFISTLRSFAHGWGSTELLLSSSLNVWHTNLPCGRCFSCFREAPGRQEVMSFSPWYPWTQSRAQWHPLKWLTCGEKFRKIESPDKRGFF